MNKNNSSIEIFPDELFLELFEYFSPYDLYSLFYNLNKRLNLLIHSIKNFHFILHEDWDKKNCNIPFFVSQISKLIIQHDEFIDLTFYSNIRLLKLSMPTLDQCNAIQPSLLPNLEYLYISNFYFSDNTEQLCHWIFSSEFSRLHTCQIDRMTLTHSSSSSTLRQLIISPCTWKSNMYKSIFKACPNLICLKIIRLRHLSFDLLTSYCFHSHTSLRYLHMHFYSIGNDWYRHIKWLLSIVPNLENFILRIDQNETNIEFPLNLLARLLIQYVPNLIDFKGKIPLNRFLSMEFNEIKCLHPLFYRIQYQRYLTRDLNKFLIISSR